MLSFLSKRKICIWKPEELCQNPSLYPRTIEKCFAEKKILVYIVIQRSFISSLLRYNLHRHLLMFSKLSSPFNWRCNIVSAGSSWSLQRQNKVIPIIITHYTVGDHSATVHAHQCCKDETVHAQTAGIPALRFEKHGVPPFHVETNLASTPAFAILRKKA